MSKPSHDHIGAVASSGPFPASPLAFRFGLAAAIAVLSAVAGGQATAADCNGSPAPKADWQQCDKAMLMLEGSDLSGANLAEANFTSTDLRGSNLQAANLQKATLIMASLAGSKADKTNFTRVDAYRASFASVSAQGAVFTSAELQRVDFTGADLTGADFQKAELGRAEFSKAILAGTSFPRANLSRALLKEATFQGPIDLTGAFMFLTRIEGIDLTKATGLQQAQVDQACGDANTKLPAGLKAPAGWPCKFEFD